MGNVFYDMKSASGKPVTRTTYGDHGFDCETVRYVLVCPREWNITPIIGDLTDWGALMLRINENDYETINISSGVWVICEPDTMIMLKIKYQDCIIIEFTQNIMELIMRQARRRVASLAKINRIDIDYMSMLSRMHMIKRAIGRYIEGLNMTK